MHLCQNIRGGGEKVIISFLWKSFFLVFLIYERQTSWMWLWEGLTGMDLRMVLIKLYSCKLLCSQMCMGAAVGVP